jgi:hypothetical protein
MKCRKPSALVEVAEVVVISHHHHEMFYHMVQDQYYRLFVLLPFLQQHPEIHVYLEGWGEYFNGSFGDKFFKFCNISTCVELLLFPGSSGSACVS